MQPWALQQPLANQIPTGQLVAFLYHAPTSSHKLPWHYIQVRSLSMVYSHILNTTKNVADWQINKWVETTEYTTRHRYIAMNSNPIFYNGKTKNALQMDHCISLYLHSLEGPRLKLHLSFAPACSLQSCVIVDTMAEQGNPHHLYMDVQPHSWRKLQLGLQQETILFLLARLVASTDSRSSSPGVVP